jgi:ParB/RepB/Spo0J family partition protein
MKIKDIGLMIPVKKVTISPHHFRKETGDERLEDLANSLKKYGQIHAVSVIEKNGGFELINGHRRLKAAKLADLPTLRANTYEFEAHEGDDGARRQAIAQFLLAANKQEPLVPIERARFWQWCIEQLEMTQEDLAQVHSVPVEEIISDLMFLNLDTAVLDLVAAAPDRFSQQHLRVLAEYASPGKKSWRITPSEQKKLAQKLLTQEDKAASASAKKFEAVVKYVVKERREKQTQMKQRGPDENFKDLLRKIDGVGKAVKELVSFDLSLLPTVDPGDKNEIVGRIYNLADQLVQFGEKKVVDKVEVRKHKVTA